MADTGAIGVLRRGAMALLAELVATCLLAMIGCMGCVPGMTPTVPTHLQISLQFGLVIMFNIQTFGHVSGCHMNPAVTLAGVLYGALHPILAVGYVICQVVGAILGFGVLRLLTPAVAMFPPGATVGTCSTVPHADLNVFQAFFVEFIITMILILVTCSIWDPANKRNTDSVPIKFGLLICCMSIVAGPYTGASMNPARTFGPALWNGDWAHHWIYWVAPLSSALVTTLAYKLFFYTKETKDQVDANEQVPLQDKPTGAV